MSDFWINDPKTLWRFRFDSTANILNSLSLIVLIVTIVVSLIMCSVKPFYIGAIVIAIFGIVYYIFYNNEGFNSLFPKEPSTPYLPQPPGAQLPPRQPSLDNPFMNVPLDTYDQPPQTQDYQRYATGPYQNQFNNSVRNRVEQDFVNTGEMDFVQGLFQDPNGKLWDRQNSQRQYVSQPIGGVPNKSVEFGQWLYGNTDEALCKQASIWSRYGLSYVPNNCNGFNISTPTGFGIKE